MSGAADRHVKALADDLDKKNHTASGIDPYHTEGRAGAKWIIMDYIDVVVHIFSKEAREFYNLERLWDHAKRVDWMDE